LTAAALAAGLAIALALGEEGGARAVSVWDGHGAGAERCSAIAVGTGSRADQVRGGCVLDAVGYVVDIAVLTAVGDVPFGRCTVEYDVHVDGAGRTVLDRIAFPGGGACGDAEPCWTGRKDGEVRWLPWRGRIVRTGDGELEHRVDACFDTCMGRFEGPLALELDLPSGATAAAGSSRSRTMSVEAPARVVGESGWRLDGAWTIGMKDVDIRDG
jgi:hypothetical protein